MRYCSNCGNQLGDNALFCSSCGSKIVNNISQASNTYQPNLNNYYQQYQPYQKTPTQTLADRERASAIVWTIIACIQGAIGFFTMAGLSLLGEIIGISLGWGGLFILALAGYNGYGAYCSFQRVKRVMARQRGIVAEYDRMLASTIVFIVLNILFGAIIGVAGAVFDLFNRSYALSNAQYLED